VTGAIDQVGAQTTYDLCFNRDGRSNPDLSIDDPNGMCRRIVRDAVTGNRERVISSYANLGSLRTAGVDVQASWTVRPAELGFERVPGALSLELSLNRLLEFGSQSFPTSEVRENRGTLSRLGLFTYRALTTLRYATSRADVALEWTRLPSVRNQNFVTDPLTQFAGAESYSLFDLSAGWSASSALRVLVGIDNLFDRDPNRVGAGPANNGAGDTMPGFYDVLGRRYYAALRLQF
jgi:outer membrane receptor protein involved in Fe transport